ncbi:MAG: MATE family efflux transporter [Fimbriimonadaceae bacterium]
MQQSIESSAPPEKHESAARIVWTLAWPAVALNSLQTLNMLLDTFFVQQLERSALTAHGASTSIMFLMFSLSMAVGTAATALVSRAFGAKQVEEFIAANRQTISLALVVGTLLAGICIAIAPGASAFFTPASDPRSADLMQQFLVVYALGLPAIYVIQALAGSLRGIGDTKSPMVISGIQILLHILLNYMLIFPPRELPIGITLPGFDLGFVGAAYALTISAWLAAAAYVMWTARTPLGASWQIVMPIKAWVKRITRLALPAGVNQVVRVGSFSLFILVLRDVPQGELGLAALRPGITIESFAFMPAFGLSIAAATLVGQSLGMKKPERAEKLAHTSALHGLIVTTIISVLLFVFADPLARALTPAQPEVAFHTANFIRFLAVTEPFFGIGMIYIGAMQGAGDTVRPMWISIICLWVLRVPMAFLFAFTLSMGVNGAWLSLTVSQLVQGIFAYWLWRKGFWKTQKV